MMGRRFRRNSGIETALANFALTFAKALLVFCVCLFVMITPTKKAEDGVKPKIEVMVSIEWSGKFEDDVDIWMRTPDGSTVWYKNKESGSVFLDRDDLGYDCDKQYINTGSVPPADGLTCEEIISLRALTPGEYIVNIHLYHSRTGRIHEPDMVQAKIEKLNPVVKVLWRGAKAVTEVDQELHMVRFTITPDGEVTGFSEDRPIMIRPKGLAESAHNEVHH